MAISSVEQVAELIQAAARVAVVSHVNPDHDAFGSQAALVLALRQLGKSAVALNESGAPGRLTQLVALDQFYKEPPQTQFDLVLVCDCGELKRVGDSLISWIEQQLLVNIDHHISNTLFAQYNLVEENSSSTCELVFKLLAALKIEVTAEIADCLYAGIAGDTGFFKYASTTAMTLNVASQLVAAGAQPARIAEILSGNVSMAAVQLQSEVLSNLRLSQEGRCAIGIVDQQLFKKHQAVLEDADDLVEKIRDISGVSLAVMIRQDSEVWKVSLRSKRNLVNVSELAANFKGGGHVMAAAFRWRGSLEQLLEQLDWQVARVLA